MTATFLRLEYEVRNGLWLRKGLRSTKNTWRKRKKILFYDAIIKAKKEKSRAAWRLKNIFPRFGRFLMIKDFIWEWDEEFFCTSKWRHCNVKRRWGSKQLKDFWRKFYFLVCVSSFCSFDFFAAGYAFNSHRNKFAKHENLQIYLRASKKELRAAAKK